MKQQEVTKDFPKVLGALEIKYRMLSELAPHIELHTNSDQQVVAGIYDGVAVELSNPVNNFVEIESVCKNSKIITR